MSKSLLLLFSACIFVSSTEAYADKLDLDGILRSDDGSIRYIDRDAAMTACPQGTHLPTIRELAELSKANGAKGILELNQLDPKKKLPAGYYGVHGAINPDGKKDSFYYNPSGYVRPSGDLGKNWFWSSSIDSLDCFDYQICNYFMYGNSGSIFYGGPNAWGTSDSLKNAVRCVADQ
jgi:hypothetical protein